MKKGKKILFMAGTRPEAVKIVPVLKEFQKDIAYDCYLCSTGQHDEMIKQTFKDLWGGVNPDFELDVLRKSPDIFSLSSNLFQNIGNLYSDLKPEMVFVQGDTTTVLIASICAYLNKIPIAHIEAGLRTGNIYSPHPEEGNRKMVAGIASFHFAPTKLAAKNLEREGVEKSRIFVTGNTAIDTIKHEDFHGGISDDLVDETSRKFLSQGKKMVLVTCHRRENIEIGIDNICNALISISKKFKDIFVVFPVHLNPIVRKKVFNLLLHQENIVLLDPIPYKSFLSYMKKSFVVMTDSGGIQEEAPYFDVPVLVLRENTERQEGLEAGTSCLCGVSQDSIEVKFENLYFDKELYLSMSRAKNPYGDGNASRRIKKIIDGE